MQKKGTFMWPEVHLMQKIDCRIKKFKKVGYDMGIFRINCWLNTFLPSTKIL